MRIKFEVMSDSIDSVDLKTDIIFLINDILDENKVIPPKMILVSYF